MHSLTQSTTFMKAADVIAEYNSKGRQSENFFTILRNLDRLCECNIPVVKEHLVRDQFIVGLWDEKLFVQLCLYTKLSAKEGLCQAQKHEESEKEGLFGARFCEIAAFDSLNANAARREKIALSAL